MSAPSFSSSMLWWGLLCAIAAALVLAAAWVRQVRRVRLQQAHLSSVLEGRATTRAAASPPPPPFLERPGHWVMPWLDSRLGKALVADEDRAVLVQSGFSDAHSQATYLAWRMFLSLLLPVLAVVLQPAGSSVVRLLIAVFFGFAIGLMAPKWYLIQRAKARRRQAAKELPLLVDLLRLLQGAGMGLDQCLQLIASDFHRVLPVLAREVLLSNQLYASGRSREHAFLRLSDMFQSDQLADLTALMLQIDKHGGAVQEPLRLFGDRLREQRRADMKERIGKITVKMTVVMVMSLLPALMIITAGPGMLAVIRTLGAMQ